MTCQASRESDPEKPAYVSACMSELNAGCNIIALHKKKGCVGVEICIFLIQIQGSKRQTFVIQPRPRCGCVCRSVGVSVSFYANI